MWGWVPASLYGAVDGLTAHPKNTHTGIPRNLSEGHLSEGKGRCSCPLRFLRDWRLSWAAHVGPQEPQGPLRKEGRVRRSLEDAMLPGLKIEERAMSQERQVATRSWK